MSTDRCLVTVRREGRDMWVDLELPCDQPATSLVESILQVMKWQSDPVGKNRAYNGLFLKVEPGSYILKPEETLEGANVREGAILVLTSTAPREAQRPAATNKSSTKAPATGPDWLKRKVDD